jgi:hypothetical protein
MIEPDINVMTRIKEAFNNFGIMGVSAMQSDLFDSKSVVTGLIIGIISAAGTSFVLTDRTATKLEISQKADSEFRAEMRKYMENRNDEMLRLHDRLARIETVLTPRHADVMSGMSGMGLDRRRSNGNNER